MAREATGWVKQDKRTGRFIATVQKKYLGSYATEQEAWDAINAKLDVDRGKTPDLLSVFGENWMKEREESGEVRGFASERSLWVMHIVPSKLYSMQLKKVRTPDVTAALTLLAKKRKTIIRRTKDGVVRVKGDTQIGEQTIKHVRRLLRSCFAAAVAEGIVPANPVDEAKLPKSSEAEEEEDEWTFLFEEEIVALFEAIEAIVPANRTLKPKTRARLEQRRAFYRAVYAIAIYGGLRQGEIFGLHWEDIHFEQRGRGDKVNCIKVRRTRNMGKAPKTSSSKRSVPMLKPLRDALDQWRRHGGIVKTHGKVFPADGSAGQGNVPKELGGYFGKSYDAAWEVRFRALATNREYVTFHDLRHTCASHLVMGTWGLPLLPHEVADWLGHSDLKTTKRYMHLAPGSLNDLVAKMEGGATKAEAAQRLELARQSARNAGR